VYVEVSREVAFCGVSSGAEGTLKGPGVVEEMVAEGLS